MAGTVFHTQHFVDKVRDREREVIREKKERERDAEFKKCNLG